MWKRTDKHWGLSVNMVGIPQGHNPNLRHLVRLFLLNASTAAASRCVRSWFRLRIKAEARAPDKPDVMQTLKHEDVLIPVRTFSELRLILEDTYIAGGTGLTVCHELRS